MSSHHYKAKLDIFKLAILIQNFMLQSDHCLWGINVNGFLWVAPSHKFIPELACLKVLGRFQILILQNPTTLNFYSISCSINIMMIFFFLRGRHGIVRRVLDKFTGSQYAAKFIFVCDEHQKRFFRTELNILRWLNQRGVPKVVDAFVTERRIVIITEMYP